MAVEQLRQKFFVDGNLAILERGQLALVIVDQDHVMPKVRETGACDQPYVSGAYDSNPHVLILRYEISCKGFVWIASSWKPRGELKKTVWRN
jgi:hypothetical protein